MTEQSEAPLALLKKLLSATKAIEPVQKKGWNEGGKYHFAEAVDIVREGNRVLTSRKVLVIPSTVDVSWRFGQSGALATVTMEFRVTDVESGESMSQRWIGAGYDKDCDKAVYQAQTGAAKYFYSQLLSIPIEKQDPEYDGTRPVGEPASRTTPAEEANARAEAARERHRQDRAAEQSDLPSPEPVDAPPSKEPVGV